MFARKIGLIGKTDGSGLEGENVRRLMKRKEETKNDAQFSGLELSVNGGAID